MGMNVDVAVRWQIDPQDAPRTFTEIRSEDQIHNAVLNAIRGGVRDRMVQYTINDVQQRDKIAEAMELRNLEPPPQVVQAINNEIAQEQQIETERHRVEVARLQSEQQRLLNQTLTSEALPKQYWKCCTTSGRPTTSSSWCRRRAGCRCWTSGRCGRI